MGCLRRVLRSGGRSRRGTDSALPSAVTGCFEQMAEQIEEVVVVERVGVVLEVPELPVEVVEFVAAAVELEAAAADSSACCPRLA